MSPMPRPPYRAPSLVLFSMVLLTAALASVAPAWAQETNGTAGDGNGTDEGNGTGAPGGPPAGDDVPRYVTIRALDGCEDGRAYCWDMESIVALPGDTLHIFVDLTQSTAPHNLAIADPIGEATSTETGVVQELVVTVPDRLASPIEYVCEVHPDVMFGSILAPDMLGAASEETHVVQMGVHFLAYWVGVIAFAILFLVYGATFFLFKYNETPATTDHWDRTGADAGSRMGNRTATLLAILVALVAIAVVVWLVRLG